MPTPEPPRPTARRIFGGPLVPPDPQEVITVAVTELRILGPLEIVADARSLPFTAPRRLRNPDRQNVVYAAARLVVMPRSWKRVCMPMRKVS
jgi:hypothetical protein